MNLYKITKGLKRGSSLYNSIAPSPISIFKKTRIIRTILKTMDTIDAIEAASKGPDEFGEFIGRKIVSKVIKKPIRKILSNKINRASRVHRPIVKINGVGGRTWFDDIQKKNGRRVVNMVVMYHDANRAGKHLDVHIGPVSFIIRISGKPIEEKVKFNRFGELTKESKEALLVHISEEVKNSSRVPQNLDHSISNAMSGWLMGEGSKQGYGSGPTRQKVIEEPVEILSVNSKGGKSARLFIPSIKNSGQIYIHKLYPGDGKRAPIVIMGDVNPAVPNFKDKLHLKMVWPEDFKEEFMKKVDPTTITKKEDGASTFFDISKNAGASFWSPRISKETGRRIEYTHKLPEFINLRHKAESQGIGELWFVKKMLFLPFFSRLSSAEVGGVLNSNKVRPGNIFPRFSLYRIDRWFGEDVSGIPFHDNRILQEIAAKMHRFINVVVLVKSPTSSNKNWEGLVGVPAGASINDGLKVKWDGDQADWEITSVDLKWGLKGHMAGVVWFKSLESGKRFKLGPGQIGDENKCVELMNEGDDAVGRVYKVVSRRGHEGRAAKIIEPHLDKGN